MIEVLFILGGMFLGFSLLFLFAPHQISNRNLGVTFGRKPKNKGVEGLINKVISIDEKISIVGTAMGIFLLVMTVVLFWTASALLR